MIQHRMDTTNLEMKWRDCRAMIQHRMDTTNIEMKWRDCRAMFKPVLRDRQKTLAHPGIEIDKSLNGSSLLIARKSSDRSKDTPPPPPHRIHAALRPGSRDGRLQQIKHPRSTHSNALYTLMNSSLDLFLKLFKDLFCLWAGVRVSHSFGTL